MSIAIPAKVSWLSSRHSMRSPKSPDSEFTETDVEEVRFRIKHTENDVMVSYCRRNTPFVKDLVKYLNSLGIDPWVDWEDIRPAVDWMKAIRHGIVDAYAFICVLSPEYLESKICLEELGGSPDNLLTFSPIS
uniref:TIR domain-containing protein n=1 Tax=Lotharella globosa TaxID=91324 RepID=A0A7S3YSA0_9EUKA|mmetsp:Transcript_9803/g.19303  ORF Transcript_9803/g.19303 Transcript_9803/m.19303 type:complete len:133 (+) Transcript_9803:110-508(+)